MTDVRDESFPLGCGAAAPERVEGVVPHAGTMTGRWDHTKPNGRLKKATITLTREELEALIRYHNKALAAYGHVNEVVTSILHGIVETSFGERASYNGDGQLMALPRDYFSHKDKLNDA